jgi:hypothetical protein
MLEVLTLVRALQEPETTTPPLPPLVTVERSLLTVPEEYKEGTLRPSFAPNGTRVALAVDGKDGRGIILADGVASEPHDFVNTPQFSADGKHLAWVWGNLTEKDREEWELFLDGKRVKKADWIGNLVFAPVGDDYAYWSGEDVRRDNDWYSERGEYTCTWGKKKADGFSRPPWQDPIWSADGKHLGFVGSKPSRTMVVVDGKEFGPYSFASGFTWSPDGKTAAWSAMEGWERTLIYTGKKSFGKEHESVGTPALGADGAMAYLATVRGRATLVFRDLIVPGAYDDLGTPAISPDGKRVVVAANNGRPQEAGGWYVDNAWMDGALNWQEDEAALAAAGSACFMVLDGKKIGGDWWRVVRPFFSPDSRRVAARARSAAGWHVLLDDRASAAYDDVQRLRFSSDGKLLEFGARRGMELLWVQIAVD